MNKSAFRLIIVIIGALFVGGAYFTGVILTSFDTNLCYSETISIIQDNVEHAIKTGESSDLLRVKELLDSLPLRGYESDCREIYEVVKTYNKPPSPDTSISPSVKGNFGSFSEDLSSYGGADKK